jgi:hypothetical protein
LAGQWNIAGRQFATPSTFTLVSGSVGGGSHNFAVGSNSYCGAGTALQAVGGNATVGGGSDNNVLNDTGVVVGGARIVATGINAVAGGSQNYAVGNNSVTLGANNVTIGNNSVALGSVNWVTGTAGTSISQGGWAAHNNAVTLGRNARTSANFDVVVGNDANSDHSPDAVSFRIAGDKQDVHVGRPSDQPSTDVSQAATLTTGAPAVFTVAAAPAAGSIVTIAGTFPASFQQDVAVYSTASSTIVFDNPHTIPTGTALFTVGTCLQQKFTFSQPCSFYDVAGPAKAIQLYTASGAGYYFWFSVYDGANVQTDPALTGTGIEVGIGLADTPTAANVATEFYSYISRLYGIFNATNTNSAEVKVSNFIPGVATAAVVTGSGATLIQTQAGAAGTAVDNGLRCSFPTTGIALSASGYPAGLTKGVSYYVINSTGTSFNLALTPTGTAMTVGGFQDTVSDIVGNFGFSHRLTFDGIASGTRYS